MRNIYLFTMILFAFCWQRGSAQGIIAAPQSNPIVAKQIISNDLMIPIEINFVNETNVTRAETIRIEIIVRDASIPIESQIGAADVPRLRIINDSQQVSLLPGETRGAANKFYLFMERSISIDNDKILLLRIRNNASVLGTIKVNIQPPENMMTLKSYMDDVNNKLDSVSKVESSNNILTISGYKKITVNGNTRDVYLKKNVALKRGDVLAVIEWNHVFSKSHWRPWPISITTIPFKVRPKITAGGNDFKRAAMSGLSNFGFNLDMVKRQVDRYFANDKKSTHKWSLGVWAAPSVEDLDEINTNSFLATDEKSKQLFISTGITISYTYNDISFVFVPIGWDFGTSTIGKKWVYDEKRWWGFGIAISPKIFATVLNK